MRSARAGAGGGLQVFFLGRLRFLRILFGGRDFGGRSLKASRLRDQLLADAQARAQEFTSMATVNTAAILALEHEVTPETRGSLLLREFRTKVANIMNKVGSATLVDPEGGTRPRSRNIPRSFAKSSC